MYKSIWHTTITALLISLGTAELQAEEKTPKIPAVTVGSGGLWITRGSEGERTVLMSRVEGLEGELQQTRDMQRELADKLETALNQLSSENTERKNSNELRAQLGDAQKSMKAFQYELEDLENRSLMQQRDHLAIKQLLEKEKMSLQGDLQHQEAALQQQQERIAELEALSAEQEQAATAMKAELEALQAALVSEQDKALGLSEEIEKLNTLRENEKNEYLVAAEQFTADIKTLRQEKDALKQELTVIQSAIQERENQILAHENSLAERATQITNLEQQLTAAGDENTSLRNELRGVSGDLNTKQDSHRAQLETMVQELSQLRGIEKQLKADMAKQAEGLVALQEQNQALKAASDEQAKQIAALEVEREKLRGEGVEQEKSIVQSGNRIKELELEINGITSKREKLSRGDKDLIRDLQEEVGSLKASEKWFEERTKELEALIQEEKAKLAALAEKENNLRDEADQLKSTVDQQAAAIAKLSAIANESSQIKSLLENQTEELSEAQNTGSKIKIQIQGLLSQLDEARKESKQRSEEVRALQTALEKSQGSIDEVRTQLLSAKNQATEKESLFMSQIETSRIQFEQLARREAETQENLAAVAAERDQLKLDITHFKNLLSSQELRMNSQKKLLSDLNETMRVAEESARKYGTNTSVDREDFERITSMNEKLERHQKMLSISNKKADELQLKLLRVEGELARVKQERDQLKAEAENQSTASVDGDAAQQEADIRRELDGLRKSLIQSEAEIQKNQLEIETLTSKVKVRENEIAELKTARATPQDQASMHDNKLLQKQLESVNRELQRYRKERDFYESELKKAKTTDSVTSSNDEDALKNTVKELSAQLKKVKREAESYRQTAELLEKATPTASAVDDSRIKDLEQQLKNERDRRKAVTEILKEKDREIKALKSTSSKASLAPSSTVSEVKKALATEKKEPEILSSKTAPTEEVMPPAKPMKEIKSTEAPADKNYITLTASGNAKLKQGNIREAISDFEAAIRIEPNSPSAPLGLAGCYYTLGKNAKAKETAQQVLKVEPNNPQALGLLSIISWAEGDLKRAAKLIKQALASTQTDPQLFNYLGVIQHTQGNPKQAIKSLEKAVSLDPSHSEAHFNLAVMYATSEPKDIDSARKHYEQALTLGSQRDDSLEQLLIP